MLQLWVQKAVQLNKDGLLAPFLKLYGHLFKDERSFNHILVEIDRSEVVFSTTTPKKTIATRPSTTFIL